MCTRLSTISHLRVCACRIRPMYVLIGISCMVACLSEQGVMPVAARRCIMLFILKIWAMLSVTCVVLSPWCLILGPSKIIVTKACCMGDTGSAWHPAGNPLNKFASTMMWCLEFWAAHSRWTTSTVQKPLLGSIKKCKCKKASLDCTSLCACDGECSQN